MDSRCSFVLHLSSFVALQPLHPLPQDLRNSDPPSHLVRHPLRSPTISGPFLLRDQHLLELFFTSTSTSPRPLIPKERNERTWSSSSRTVSWSSLRLSLPSQTWTSGRRPTPTCWRGGLLRKCWRLKLSSVGYFVQCSCRRLVFDAHRDNTVHINSKTDYCMILPRKKHTDIGAR